MLIRLHIQNIALISDLELTFHDRLNILSGETGAGKSIVVDSIMLLLGGRYDKSMLRFGAAWGQVEGVFDTDDRTRGTLTELGLDADDDIILLSRRFTTEGRNEIRINGRTATLSMLKTVSAGLIDICGQNEHQILSNPVNHGKVLDYYVRHNTQSIRQKLAELCAEYRDTERQLNEIGDESERGRSIDIYRFQLDEIRSAKIRAGELEELTQKRKKCVSAERIGEALGGAYDGITGDEGALPGCHRAGALLRQIGQYGELYESLAERLSVVTVELNDIAETLADEVNDIDFSPAELDALENRIETLRTLERKYGAFDHMLAFAEELERKLDVLENAGDHYERLAKRREALLDGIYDNSVRLSEQRRAAAKTLEQSVMRELGELAMGHSLFEVRFEPFPSREACHAHVSASGMDRMEFYLSPNPGQPLQPLIKIISGGELSRLMLALKVVSGHVDDTPTLIFDEIDTGISGRVGQEIAKKLARLSVSRQLLCVTHLPQIASMADMHYFISKAVVEGNTFTSVTPLNRDEAVEEIARLSGSKDISLQSDAAAAEMKAWSDTYKAALLSEK